MREIILTIIEGLGLGILLILVCAFGIRKGAIGMVHLYSQEVQNRCVEQGLTTHQKIKRNSLIFKAICITGYIAYGAFENNELIGYAEGSIESWNNRFRISNIRIFDKAKRNLGVGTKLINIMLEVAKSFKARMVVLETQSCNEPAIAFYKKHGFEIIGFDLYSYSNDDLDNHEVRIEMGKKLI